MITGLRSIFMKTAATSFADAAKPWATGALSSTTKPSPTSKSSWPAWLGESFTQNQSITKNRPRIAAGTKNASQGVDGDASTIIRLQS